MASGDQSAKGQGMNILAILLIPMIPFMMLKSFMDSRLRGFAEDGIIHEGVYRPVMQRRIA